MAYLKNRATIDVIGGVRVTRFNGNGCTRSRQTGSAEGRGSSRPAYWITKGQKAAAYKRVQETAFRRRYLGA